MEGTQENDLRKEFGARPMTPQRGRQSKNKWDDINAIEYDAGTQSLSKILKENIRGKRASIQKS